MATGIQDNSRLSLIANNTDIVIWDRVIHFWLIVVIVGSSVKVLDSQVLDVVIGPFGCPLGLRGAVREPRVVWALGPGALVLSVAAAEGWHVSGK